MRHRPETLHIAILCQDKEEYEIAIERILPGLEKYHKIKFIKNHADNSYKATGFIVRPALKAKDVLGLRDYQLMKYGNFMNNPDATEIIEHWQADTVRSLRKSAPSLGQD